MVGAELAGQLQGRLGRVDDDDLGRRVRLQALDADVAEAAGADHHDAGARAEDSDRLLDGVDRGEPGVGERGDVRGLQGGVELDDRARARQQELGEAAVAVDAGKRAVLAMHVVAGAARPAQPAGDERVDDDGIPDLDVRDRRSDLVDPAGVLVARRVGQLDLGLLGPLALLDVQVRAAEAGRADAHDDVQRSGHARLVDLERLVVGVQACSFHAAISSGLGMGVVADAPLETRQPRHALLSPLEHDVQLAATHDAEVGAFVRAREQVADQAGEVVQLALPRVHAGPDEIAEGGRDAVGWVELSGATRDPFKLG